MRESARTRFYRILEGTHPRTPMGWVADVLLIALISTNVFAAILETVSVFHARFGTFFLWFEVVSVAVFTVEYAARVWVSVEDPDLQGHGPVKARLRYLTTPLALIDLVAIAPVYLGLIFILDLRWLRLLRLLRLFKLTRYWSALNLLYRVMREEAQVIGAALFLLCVVMVLAAGGIYIFEHRAQPEAFGSVPAAMWWTVSTLTTVGYGDVVPVTLWGKVFGGLISLIGIGMVAFPAGILAAGFADQIRRGRRLYRERVDEVMAEGLPDSEMEAELEEARTELGLSEDLVTDIDEDETERTKESAYCPHCGGLLSHPED